MRHPLELYADDQREPFIVEVFDSEQFPAYLDYTDEAALYDE